MSHDSLDDRIRSVLTHQADSIVVPPPDPHSVHLAPLGRPVRSEVGWHQWRRLALVGVLGLLAVVVGGVAAVWSRSNPSPATPPRPVATRTGFAAACEPGTGAPGQLMLEWWGPLPIDGSVRFNAADNPGYGSVVALRDAATCEPAQLGDGIEVRVVSADATVAAIDGPEVTADTKDLPIKTTGTIAPSVSFVIFSTGAGRTTLTVEVVDTGSGATVARLDIPVLVR